MTFLKYGAVAVLGFVSLTTFLATDSAAQGRPKGLVFAEIAVELGISEEDAKGCFPQHERGGQSEGSARPERPDMRIVADCLANTDTTLTAEQIETALKENHGRRGKPANRG